MLKTIVHVLGGTCVGKSTIIDSMVSAYGEKVVAVSVGKALRAKYLDPRSPHFNPDKFKGRGSPAEMESEAMGMYRRLLRMALASDCELIIVDGQPRTAAQARMIGQAGVGVHHIENLNQPSSPVQNLLNSNGLPGTEDVPAVKVSFRYRYLYLHASDDVRRERLGARFGADSGVVSDPEKSIGYELGLARLTSDDRDNLEVLIELGKLATPIAYLDTSECVLGDEGKEKLASFAPALWEIFSAEPEKV